MSKLDYKRKRDFLLCIDSDGCAVDSMTIKHERAFGPAFVEVFNLQKYAQPILKEWNRINLYSLERGINRFKGLAKIIDYTNKNFQKIEGTELYNEFIKKAKELNISMIEEEYKKTQEPIYKLAIDYSHRVNNLIDSIPDKEINLFENVKEALIKAKDFADIVVVSSANKTAVHNEWNRLSISKYVDYFYTQEDGTKIQIIQQLKAIGQFSQKQILKIGDSMGDFEAAELNHVLFYPILVETEDRSWKLLENQFLEQFEEGTFFNSQKELSDSFLNNLGKKN